MSLREADGQLRDAKLVLLEVRVELILHDDDRRLEGELSKYFLVARSAPAREQPNPLAGKDLLQVRALELHAFRVIPTAVQERSLRPDDEAGLLRHAPGRVARVGLAGCVNASDAAHTSGSSWRGVLQTNNVIRIVALARHAITTIVVIIAWPSRSS